jgi:hypothetical protein
MIRPEDLAACGSESGHQKALFCWAALNVATYPQLKWLYAVPNGFFSTSGQKAKMKAEGLRDGVPDICLAVPTFSEYLPKVMLCAGLYIELKIEKRRNQKNGGCSEEQLEWLDYLQRAGYKALVCYGWQEAVKAIEEYLNG